MAATRANIHTISIFFIFFVSLAFYVLCDAQCTRVTPKNYNIFNENPDNKYVVEWCACSLFGTPHRCHHAEFKICFDGNGERNKRRTSASARLFDVRTGDGVFG